MFENLTMIPHLPEDLSLTDSAFAEIVTTITNVISRDKYRTSWTGNWMFNNINMLLAALASLNLEDDERYISQYSDNNEYSFSNRVASTDSSRYGIIINEEPSTHFSEMAYSGATYLTGAQTHLKQSPKHFLKIFKMPGCSTLFVWTNQQLAPDTMYKLYELEGAINQRKKNNIAYNLVHAFIENDLNKAKDILTTFMNSDNIQELAFKQFSKCLSSSCDKRIKDLESSIENYRSSINSFEATIASYAAQIREWSDNIAFIKSNDKQDEQRLFFKHLMKIPYITSFTGNENGYIVLNYNAPLIYYADFPAKKMLRSNYNSNDYKTIIKIILGRKYELWTKCTIKFYTQNFNIENASDRTPRELLPHPHIARFSCFGNHRRAIAESAEAGDYIGAIEQITQAVLNLNFYDSCVIDEMCRTLQRSWDSLPTWKCLETGEMLTTAQVAARGDYYEET